MKNFIKLKAHSRKCEKNIADMLIEQSRCCGCGACAAVCPQHAIIMEQDVDGFPMPHITEALCKRCGLCSSSCFVMQGKTILETSTPLYFGAFSRDEEIRLSSSSGGVFPEIARYFLRNNGIVYGCTLKTPEHAAHIRISNMDELPRICGSKYLQSDLGNSFHYVLQDLKNGHRVLFSGTPCQISGLHAFLRKRYENLLTVEVICHGVVSPKIWQRYLDDLCQKRSLTNILSVDFRNKKFTDEGWKNYHLKIDAIFQQGVKKEKTVISEEFRKNDYMCAFLANLSLRSSCYQCSAKGGKSGADITLGDFWGVERFYSQLDTAGGVSVVVVHTPKGMEIWKQLALNLESFPVKLPEIEAGNPCFRHSVTIPPMRAYFMKNFTKKDFHKVLHRCINGHPLLYLSRRFYRKVRNFFK